VTSVHHDTPGADQIGTGTYPFAHERIDTDVFGHTTTYRYDSLNRLLSVTNAEGNTKVNTYDGVNLQSATDFKGQATKYQYDDLDRPILITDRMNKQTVIGYLDNNGLTKTITDRRGNQRIEVYDPLNRLSNVTLGGQALASYEYDGNNNRTVAADGLGNQSLYTYDPFNRVTQVTHGVTTQNQGGLQTETFGYDNNGNVTTHFDGVNTVTRTFDELNRLLKSVDGAGDITQFQYDGRNLMTAKIEPNRDSQGNPTSTTNYQYNELGSLTQVTDAAGKIWTYGYDAKQRLTSITDALKNPQTTFGYDVMDRLQTVTRPLGMATTYGYDANSNRTSMIDPLGRTTTTAWCGASCSSSRTMPSWSTRSRPTATERSSAAPRAGW